MNHLVGWFCLGFAIFFSAGGIVGCMNRVASEDAIDVVAVRHIALTHERVPSAPLALTYICNSHDYFNFYLNYGSLIPDQNLLDHPQVPRPFSFENIETIFVAASGWELRGIVMEAAGLTLTYRQRIALTLGAISGYSAGRWLFSTRLPSCSAPEILSKLQQTEYWNKLKRQKYKELCLRYRLIFSSVDNRPFILNADPIISAMKVAPGLPSIHNLIEVSRLQRLFRLASSDDEKLTEGDFMMLFGVSSVMHFLEKHPEILKAAFPSKAPKVGFMLNTDPAVIQRENKDTDLLLNLYTQDQNQKYQSVEWIFRIFVFTMCFCLAGVILAVAYALVYKPIRQRKLQLSGSAR
jgi:hypothetical protein